MISKQEILQLAAQLNLHPHVIEKDHVLGWFLAGISQQPALNTSWLFKGGTCLKKCYFETYRFSEDLDFTLQDVSHIDENFLRETFTEIAEWIYDNSGIEIPHDLIEFEVYVNPRGIKSCQGKVSYRGPISPVAKRSLPRIKLDLTVDETVADTPVIRPVKHDYSDEPEGGIAVLSYSYVEVFAEKIRALKQRTRPRDLYDVINFFRRPESRDLAVQVGIILNKKCEFKSIKFPQLEDLQEHKDACEKGWREQLSHQLPALPPFESFWDELPVFFEWLNSNGQISFVAPIVAYAAGETGDNNLWLATGPATAPLLDRVRFAAVNRLCVELEYRKESGQRETYLIEPYSLRRTSQSNILLYGVKLPTGEIRGFRTDRIIDARVSGRAFNPRYQVEFIPEGPVNLTIQPSRVQITSMRTLRKALSTNYIFECPICKKQFSRKKYDSKLNPHKDKYGQPCIGRVGILL